jgi:hypothetical protein
MTRSSLPVVIDGGRQAVHRLGPIQAETVVDSHGRHRTGDHRHIDGRPQHPDLYILV